MLIIDGAWYRSIYTKCWHLSYATVQVSFVLGWSAVPSLLCLADRIEGRHRVNAIRLCAGLTGREVVKQTFDGICSHFCHSQVVPELISVCCGQHIPSAPPYSVSVSNGVAKNPYIFLNQWTYCFFNGLIRKSLIAHLSWRDFDAFERSEPSKWLDFARGKRNRSFECGGVTWSGLEGGFMGE